MGPCLAFGRWKGRPAKGKYPRAGTLPLPSFPELARNPGQEGGCKVLRLGGRMWCCTWDGSIGSLQISSSSRVAAGRVDGVAECCQSWSWAVTQGSFRKLHRRTQLQQLVLRKRLRMMKLVCMPVAPRHPLCPPSKGRPALFASQPSCWLPGAATGSPLPRPLGTLASSGCGPAAFIFICFL